MFWQVMDHPGVEGNYLETSGTALFLSLIHISPAQHDRGTGL